jgi:anti-sigma factor RsiW
MNEQPIPIGEEDLHAYADGALTEERRAEVERVLEQNPEMAARVNDYFSLNQLLHDRYDRVLSEPVPKRLQPETKRRWRDAVNWPRYAGMAAALVIGIGIGVTTQMGTRATGGLAGTDGTRLVRAEGGENFAREAALAHVVYMPEVSRPENMGAGHEEDFVQWLSNRLGTDVHPPMLSKSGFRLVGGRLIPGEGGDVAQFMYHDAKGERITLCISRREKVANTTAFRLYEDGPVKVFYWIDGDFGYAVSGGIDRKVLLELAHDVYTQVEK